MILGWRKHRKEQAVKADELLAAAEEATRDLEDRVKRLEKDSEVLMLRRRRELRDRGVKC